MNKPSALVICRADPNTCPRPRRMIRTLQSGFDVTVLGTAIFSDPSVSSQVLPVLPVHYLSPWTRAVRLLSRKYGLLLWSEELRSISDRLKRAQFDLVACHDPDLLPLAVSIKGDGKILFDAREYYPLHFEDRWTWRLLYQPFNHYLCATYLRECDAVMTVSPGLAEAYRTHYGTDPAVVESVPPLFDLEPTTVESDTVRIVHHGNATPQRKLEGMIKVMDHVSDRFQLDLILVPTNRPYHRFLVEEARRRDNVRVLPSLPYEELIPRTNQYDIGMVFFPPTTFNIRFGLPNKFFEYIQARLAVAIGPSTDMMTVVDRHKCGFWSDDFEPATMGAVLEKLTNREISRFKERSGVAARELNQDTQRAKILGLVERLGYAPAETR